MRLVSVLPANRPHFKPQGSDLEALPKQKHRGFFQTGPLANAPQKTDRRATITRLPTKKQSARLQFAFELNTPDQSTQAD